MCRGVAFLTVHSNMASIQNIACQAVIELSKWQLPVDEVEVSAVVFEVAAHAVSALGILHLQAGVIAVFFRQRFGYFLVAVQAFKCRGLCTEQVATCALRGPRYTLVRFGERAGRDLSVRGRSAPCDQQ